GSLGGPVVKDKAFFFVNYEGLRQLKGVSSPVFIPDANSRVAGPSVTDPNLAAEIANTLSLYPATTLTSPTAVIRTTGQDNQSANENYFLGRFDYNLTTKDSIFARYVMDRGEFFLPSTIPIYTELDTTRSHILTAEWRRIATSNMVNLARFSMVRPHEYG